MGSRRQRGGGALVVAVALVGAAVGPSAAAEDPTVVLPGTTVTALTTDLDGDGDREIVRLIEEEDTVQFSLGFAVDAWEFDGARWLTIGSAAVPHAAGEPEGLVVGSQTAGLLLVQDGGRERVLTLSAAGMPGDRTGATCCLIISELGLTGRGDLELRTLQRDEAGASSVWVADVDGDGSDELVLHEGRYGATEDEQTAMLRVLRWNGTAFALAFERTDRELLYGFSVADSDGFAGKDLLFGPGTDGRLRRLAWVDGAMRLDESELDAGGTPDGWIAGAADGAIVLSLGEETRVVRWPRGQATTTVERLRTFGPFPAVTLVGDGPDALVVVQSQSGFQNGRPPSVAVHDLGLRLLGEVPASQATEGLWRFVNSPATSSGALQLNIHPYSGPIPRGVVGARAAYVSSGTLIQPGGAAGFETRPMASLVGVQPIGLAGPEDGWVVLGGPFGAPAGIAYLSWGGFPPEWGTLAVIQADQLLQPDDRTDAVAVELVDAVEVARAGQVATIMARAEGFKVAITAPAGSLVVVMNGALTDEHEIAGEPLLVEVGPPRHRQGDENLEFEAMLLVVTPDRRAITEQWAGTFVREPPEVSVSATTDAMALSATLAGRASPGSLVTAEGVAIETDDDGRFSASIDAPIWPSRIMVTARDPLGNEATELVEVVGLVDYRGMPWAAILVAATVLVGGVLYIRTPKRRAVAALPDGDGQLEELELDAVDGRETPRG